MEQEDKQLLLKDLCAGLPYGVMIKDTYSGHYGRLVKIGNTFAYYISELNGNTLDVQFGYVKPYLRPMSSMTSKEWVEFCDCSLKDEVSWATTGNRQKFIPFQNREDYLNSKHFDYRGLIEKGLALEAPEGMYA